MDNARMPKRENRRWVFNVGFICFRRLSSLHHSEIEARVLVVGTKWGIALYVSGRQLSYVKVAAGRPREREKNKWRLIPYRGRGAKKSAREQLLAGDARDVFDLRRLGARVCVDWFHAGGVEWLFITAIAFALAGVQLDHLAAAFEKRAWLDHQ